MMRMLLIMRSLWSDLYRETPLQWWWLALGSSWRHSWRGGMIDPTDRSLQKKTESPETPAASYHPNPRISRYHRWYRCQTPCLHALLHWCVSCQYQPDECILSSWSCCWHTLLQLQQWSHRYRSHLLVADRGNPLDLCSLAAMATTMYHDGWRRCCWKAEVGWLVLVELLVLLIRLELGTERQTIRGELLSLWGASQSSISITAMNKPIGNFQLNDA